MKIDSRKELTCLCFVFLELFLVASLLSFNPTDPSIHNATSAKMVSNLYGLAENFPVTIKCSAKDSS